MKKLSVKELVLMGVVAGCGVAAQGAADANAVSNFSSQAILAAHGCGGGCGGKKSNVAENDDVNAAQKAKKQASDETNAQEPSGNGCHGRNSCTAKSNGCHGKGSCSAQKNGSSNGRY